MPESEDFMSRQKIKTAKMPVVPIKGLMIFPGMILHFDVVRSKSIKGIEIAMRGDHRVLLLGQTNEETDDPKISDLKGIGTIVHIRQIMSLPGNVLRVLAEGECRGIVKEISETDEITEAVVRFSPDAVSGSESAEALVRLTQETFAEYAKASQRVPQETVDAIREVEKEGELADLLAANVMLKKADRQAVLEELDPKKRLEYVCAFLLHETELSDTEKQIQTRVRKQVEQHQKDYYLREQIKAIQTELGDEDENDVSDLRKQMEETPLNEEARKKCEKELERLSRMPAGSPEAVVSQTYIEWILDLPWGKESEDSLDLDHAREILNRDHYGLDKVKERIIEYIAVLQVKKDLKGPILCFVGPPGVGKTSVVRAIAEAVNRQFVQMSLGGLRDEAEIRGHRRTYLGSIPGRIIYGMKQAGTVNPVFLFDEIDKMSGDFRGDPASALLEVLDAEQNHAFRDHYMELPFDLSKVMFITTANETEAIPPALLDRMEIIEVPSYTEEEKLQILKRHLLPKQIREHGLKEKNICMSDDVMRKMIEEYTREAGVRTLERTAAKVIRKAVVYMLDHGAKKVKVTEDMLHGFLGAARYLREPIEKEPRIGVVNGLAFTSTGGEMLEVECSPMPGKGVLKLTGQLGEVMKESAEAALTYVRAHCGEFGLNPGFYKTVDIHIHVPEGAVPKDGPSAGVTMTTAIVSALAKIPVKQNVAMTGEITLRGRVLPIGGLKEKTLAAYRAGVDTLVIPRENKKDLEEIPDYILKRFRIVLADTAGDVLNTALCRRGRGRSGNKNS